MSLQILRSAVLKPADDPIAILDALQFGWKGSMTSRAYEDVLVMCIIPKNATSKLRQLEMLGLLGADLSKVQIKLTLGEEAVSDRLRRPREAQQVRLTNFLNEVRNIERPQAGMNRDTRISSKGRLIAHLEDSQACDRMLPSMKRSLILDARGRHSGYSKLTLTSALEALIVSDPDSFVWCSLTGSNVHWVDTVVRRVVHEHAEVFELTTCNRGDEAIITAIDKGKRPIVGALRSFYHSIEEVVNKLVKWTDKDIKEPMTSYNKEMHFDVSNGRQGVQPSFRPQQAQKGKNCGTKSMFSALNFLMVSNPDDGEATRQYKNVKKTLIGSLQRA